MRMDTLGFSRRMIEAGMERKQAEALAEALVDVEFQITADEARQSDLVSRRELYELEQRVIRDLGKMWYWFMAIYGAGFALLIVLMGISAAG
ncbi:hypothetical protein [Halodurantibacterium flavum]|uniref:DUF1640 domain-containing protein n=1 Tax=Halodurantibacterium flavum TaxID=1382802 RepID=A0ABW4S4A3_9RHOB